MAYFVYILKSEKSDKYYVGSIDNLERWLQDHNWSRTPSTKSGIPWKIVYSENYDSRSDATKSEYEIKAKKSKKYVEHLIQNAPG